MDEGTIRPLDSSLPALSGEGETNELIVLPRLGEEQAQRLEIDFKSELNEQQYAAVTSPGGYNLVLAGAGTGKTRVITYRVAWLISQGVPPSAILLATFTNKAAEEMVLRVERLLGGRLRGIMAGTFHSIAARLLRRYGELIGYRPDYTILDETDQVSLLRRVREEVASRESARFLPRPKSLITLFSYAINTQKSLEQAVEEKLSADQLTNLALIEAIFDRYREVKREQNLMDFDDLLVNILRLLTEHPKVRQALAERFQHVLVDEYQDVNLLQAEMVEHLSSVHGNLFVVGDDAQSIYGFRGADYTRIQSFPDRFPEVTIYKLERNYRSLSPILNLANAVMERSLFRRSELSKVLFAHRREEGEKPVLITVDDEHDQAELVAMMILRKLNEESLAPRDIAVLYRSHRYSQELEVELTRLGIPYTIRGGLRFMERAHIKDTLAFLNFLHNPRDTVSLARMLEMVPGVGVKTVNRIAGLILRSDDPFTEFIERGWQEGSSRAREGLRQVRDLLIQLREMGERGERPGRLIGHVLDEYYLEALKLRYPNWRERAGDVEQLAIFAARFENLAQFLHEIALHMGFAAEQVVQGPEPDTEGRVTLSTIHQAKGLEWRVVFIVSVNDQVIPHIYTVGDPYAHEEERRLLYVAITRAKDELYLIAPSRRLTQNDDLYLLRPSPFIKEIPRSILRRARVSWES